jgi:hypothetical protein
VILIRGNRQTGRRKSLDSLPARLLPALLLYPVGFAIANPALTGLTRTTRNTRTGTPVEVDPWGSRPVDLGNRKGSPVPTSNRRVRYGIEQGRMAR